MPTNIFNCEPAISSPVYLPFVHMPSNIFTREPAKLQGTYEYGKQLLQAALVLRRSLRYDIEPNYDRAQRLEEAWRRFSKGTSERANRLTVLALFLNESDKVRLCNKSWLNMLPKIHVCPKLKKHLFLIIVKCMLIHISLSLRTVCVIYVMMATSSQCLLDIYFACLVADEQHGQLHFCLCQSTGRRGEYKQCCP